MKKFIGLFLLSAALVSAHTTGTFAESRADQTEVYTLGEVVVSANKPGVEAIATNRVLTDEDIELSGADTLDEALALLPGLSIKTGGAGVPRIDIRGLRSRHIILLLDGIPFRSTNDDQFDPTLIPVENIARIKVSYGNSSVLYGDGGLAGVINIITKKGVKGVQASAAVEAGERNRWLGKFNVSGGSDKVYFLLSGSALDSDGYLLSNNFDETKYEDGDLRNNSDKERNSLFANIGVTPTDNLDIGIIFNYYDGEYGIPPSVFDGKDPFANNPKYDRIDDQEGVSFQLSASYEIPGLMNIRGSYFLNEMEEESNRYDDDTYSTQKNLNLKGLFHKEDESTISGGNLQFRFDLKRAGSLSVGLGTQKEEFDTQGEIVEKKGKPFVDFDNNDTTKTHSVSCEYEIYPVSALGLVMGYSHHWFEKDLGGDEDKGGFLLGAHYDITKATRFSASFAQKIRFPSIRQLYDVENGNSDLTEEKSKSYEIGISHRLAEHTLLTITGFFMDVDDYIEKDDNTPYLNHDEYRFQGVEITAETRVIKNLMLRAGYTYMDSEDKSTDSEKDELQYRPENKLTLEGKYDFKFGISAIMSILHEGGQYTYSRNTPLIKRKMNDYTIVDARIEKSFISNKISCFLGIDNLFDDDYQESYGLPREGRMFYGGIRVTN